MNAILMILGFVSMAVLLIATTFMVGANVIPSDTPRPIFVAHFLGDGELHTAELDGSGAVLDRPFGFYSAQLGYVVIAPAGMSTDFASIPRFTQYFDFLGLFPKRGKEDRPAVLHDAGYRRMLENADGQRLALTKAQIDALFLEAMQVAGVKTVPRHAMYYAVHWFGGKAFNADGKAADDPPELAA